MRLETISEHLDLIIIMTDVVTGITFVMDTISQCHTVSKNYMRAGGGGQIYNAYRSTKQRACRPIYTSVLVV